MVLPWSRVARAFPFGQFLSDGAYKQVFRVWAAGARRLEALSVMDVNAITETGNAAILAQELRASILMSALVRHRICPNHVETYGVLRTKHAPRYTNAGRRGGVCAGMGMLTPCVPVCFTQH